MSPELPFHKVTQMIENFWEWNSVSVVTLKLKVVIQGADVVPTLAHGILASRASGHQGLSQLTTLGEKSHSACKLDLHWLWQELGLILKHINPAFLPSLSSNPQDNLYTNIMEVCSTKILKFSLKPKLRVLAKKLFYNTGYPFADDLTVSGMYNEDPGLFVMFIQNVRTNYFYPIQSLL